MLAAEQICEGNLLRFAHFLRTHNYTISLAETTDSIRSLSQLSQPNKQLTLSIMRALFCRSIDDWQSFEPLFYQFWYQRELTASRKTQIETQTDTSTSQNLTGFSGSSESLQHKLDANNLKGSGAGRQNTLSKADFRFIGDKSAMKKMENLAEQLAAKIGTRRGRYQFTQSLRQQIDIRRTIRSNLSDPFLLLKCLYKQQQYKPPQLIVFHDVSHSMTWNNPLLFRYTRGLVRHFNDSHAFVFHTDLYNVTDIYKLHSLSKIREKLEQSNNLWLGGTSIACSLEKYIEQFMPDIHKQNSLVLILSDGFDTDSAEHLSSVLKQIKQQSKKLFWLSPMLANPAYKLEASNLKMAKNYLDGLLPCNSVYHLEQATRLIKAHC